MSELYTISNKEISPFEVLQRVQFSMLNPEETLWITTPSAEEERGGKFGGLIRHPADLATLEHSPLEWLDKQTILQLFCQGTETCRNKFCIPELKTYNCIIYIAANSRYPERFSGYICEFLREESLFSVQLIDIVMIYYMEQFLQSLC